MGQKHITKDIFEKIKKNDNKHTIYGVFFSNEKY